MTTDKALYDKVKHLTADGSLIKAIQHIRDRYPVGLAFAKDYAESVRDTGKFPVKLEAERLRDEIIDLHNRLQATQDTVRGLHDQNARLRTLCGRAAAMLDDELGLEGLVDDLRQAAKEGEG